MGGDGGRRPLAPLKTRPACLGRDGKEAQEAAEEVDVEESQGMRALIAFVVLWLAIGTNVASAELTSEQMSAHVDNFQSLAELPIDKSNICNTEILFPWIRDNLLSASQEALKDSAARPSSFSQKGWDTFKKSLREQSDISEFENSMRGRAFFISEGVHIASGTYQWRSNFVRKEYEDLKTDSVSIDVIIIRAAKQQSKDGLLIDFVKVATRNPRKVHQPKLDKDGCPQIPGTPQRSMFSDLEGVNFHLRIRERLLKAIDCHGKESECTARVRAGVCYQKFLIDSYEAWPRPLQPDNLEKVFIDKVAKSFLPFVKREKGCVPPIVNVLKRKSFGDDIRTIATKPKTLTVVVELTFDNQPGSSSNHNLKPKAAALSVYLYRPDGDENAYFDRSNYIAAIPLDISDDDLQARLEYIAKQSVRPPLLKE